MAHVTPARARYKYQIACDPDGIPYVGRYEDGGEYYNILAIRVSGRITNPQRVVARTDTLAKAQRLVKELTECTARDIS